MTKNNKAELFSNSPLFMVVNTPILHDLITYLTEKKNELENNPGKEWIIELKRSFINEVRQSFKQQILTGEQNLHIISHILSSNLLGRDFELHSNVIGILPGTGSRPFLIRERITQDILFSQTDIDLGNTMLGHFKYNFQGNWIPLDLSANFVEYLPNNASERCVNRLTSRVKAEEELWNKVTDEIFGFDELVLKDKHLQQYSKYIKDVFGIKIICNDEMQCHRVHEKLQNLTTAECDWHLIDSLIGHQFPDDVFTIGNHLLDFIETKNYLDCEPDQLKKTGWRALKSVVKWNNQLFEIQVQPLSNYFLELDHMAGPSHTSFKKNRDLLRQQVTERIPLYGFYRDLLKMLFIKNDVSFEYENAKVVITD